MRKFLAATVPALLLLAGTMPAEAQSGDRDVQASRDLIGKRVVHRHGGPVAGTIQNVTTDAQGQTMVEMKMAKTGQPLMLTPSSFERRGRQVVIMHDQTELQQLAQYSSQANTGYGSSTGGAMDGSMGGSMGGMGAGSMGQGTMNQGTMNQGSMSSGSMGRGTMDERTLSPNKPGMQ
ncbi:hypothetical protein A6A40_00430 [Azospirillum humicireducens]|uniref:PRC-barrel domain-containing protein n=1 Tax=Azospirillum humicireducens TaxID=1226968 RepID=A0A160JCX4_9PROT|nr:hypothetical protein [Azospirillum humicireducens]ANC90500.1 hypothetical protein A6A40_00430 [Azospirillum humicireducens]